MNPPKLIEQLRSAIRIKNYSPRTEEAYWLWIRQFILFNQKRHPNDMGESEIVAFLSHLAVTRKVTASTQNQALSALLFLYKRSPSQTTRVDGQHPPRQKTIQAASCVYQ